MNIGDNMTREIRIQVDDGQEIILTPFLKGNKHFSVWLCQGSYNSETQEYSTQFHIADYDIELWVEHLQRIQERKAEYLKQFAPPRDIFAEIAEKADSFFAFYNRKPQKLCVNAEFLEELIGLCLQDPCLPHEYRLRMAQKNFRVVEKLNLQIFGLQVVRRFDEVKETCGYVLE